MSMYLLLSNETNEAVVIPVATPRTIFRYAFINPPRLLSNRRPADKKGYSMFRAGASASSDAAAAGSDRLG